MLFLSGYLLLVLTDYGWQKTPQGEVEYIIQIEPELLDSLRRGEEIVSAIPPRLGRVTRFRIRVGNEPVPKDETLLTVSKDSERPSLPRFADDSHARGEPVERPGFAPPPLIETPVPGTGEGDSTLRELDGASKSKSRPKPIPRFPDSGRMEPSPDPPLPFRSDDPVAPVRPAAATGPAPADSPDRQTAKPNTPTVKPEKASDPSVASDTTSGKPATTSTGKHGARGSDASEATVASDPGKPWTTLVVTSLLLFASVGLNIYLGWITWGAVQRYREMARKLATALS